MVRKEVLQGIKQAIQITLYCSAISLVMWNGNKIFGEQDKFVSPIVFLVMFSTSALICGLIVFKKPYELFFGGKKNEALSVVIYTAISLFIILLLLFLTLYLLK